MASDGVKVRSTMRNWFLSVKWIATGGLITEGETEAHRGNVAFSGSRVTAAARFPSRLRRLFRRLSLRAAFTIFPATRLAPHSAWRRQDLMNVHVLKE